MEYLKVKNWEKYQHYKDRNPPWIKLYHSILDDYEYACLQDDSKLLLISLFMLAGRTDNRIPNDPKWIQSKAMITKKIDIQPLLNTGFISIYQNDSKVIADCKQNGTQRRDREEKSIYGEFKNVFLTDNEIEKLKTKFNSTYLDRIETLSRYIETFPTKGKKYKSHYATILTWAKKDGNKQKPNKNSSDAFAV